ncbi:hypothetical protein J6590_017866 [Homalodisca vitripennis]|nr:hypothetical protein J6590_017866 [Homalodisca vitripennis]
MEIAVDKGSESALPDIRVVTVAACLDLARHGRPQQLSLFFSQIPTPPTLPHHDADTSHQNDQSFLVLETDDQLDQYRRVNE